MIRLYSGAAAPAAAGPAPAEVARWRRVAAAGLSLASHRLDRAARALVVAPPAPEDDRDAVVEFDRLADGDGALYIDGVLVARLPGVGRL